VVINNNDRSNYVSQRYYEGNEETRAHCIEEIKLPDLNRLDRPVMSFLLQFCRDMINCSANANVLILGKKEDDL
jgi:hypothetical protein